MSLSNNFPTIDPSLMLDFANTQSLDPRITFTRTTTATYYDGKTTAKAEENLLLQSADFTTTWSTPTAGATVTANTETAPDGTTTADTVTAAATTGDHYVNQLVTLVASQRYVASVFAKAGTNNYIQLALATQTGTFANFDITSGAGVVGTSGGVVSTSIVDVGNDWYRCVMVFDNTNGASVSVALADSASMGRLADWTAVGTETVYLWGAQLEQRSAVSAYTPTTTQAITNYIPALQTAASGVARFDHNPTTGESLGLLVEEQRSNLQVYSQDFDNAAWSKTASSVTANTIVAPDGTLTGDKLVEDTANSGHFIVDNFNVTSGVSYTASLYIKAAERTVAQIILTSSGFSANVIGAFDLANGTATSSFGVGRSQSITAVGNGWYRCVLTAEATATASTQLQIRAGTTYSSASPASYTGDGYSGIYIWGAQLEAGAFPTSYIATTSATVTRNADAASMTGTNFSSWYRADEGTLYGEASAQKTTASCFVSIDDGSSANTINLSPSNATGAIFFGLSTANVGQLTGASYSGTTVPLKAVLSYKTDDTAWTLSGGTVRTDNTVTLPVVDRMAIGFRGALSVPFVGHLRKLSYYPTRLSNAQLQALTS